MKFPDLISMDNDDESACIPTPDHFLLSTYKENLSVNTNQTKMILSYNCGLCRKILDNPILTCSTCVNTGRFCSSTHEKCSNKRREILINMLNKNDYEEFQQYSTNKSMHFQCFERMFLLKKFNSEKIILQSEFQIKYKSSIETQQMSEEIQVRKRRLNLINHSIQRLREQIEQKKQINIETKQRIAAARTRIEKIELELNNIKQTCRSSYNENLKRRDNCNKQDKKLQSIRRERFHELITYLFPIQSVSTNEDVLERRKALLSAQQTTFDNINNESVENDDASNATDDRYQIVNSFLPKNGDYRTDNLVSIYNITEKESIPDGFTNDFDSPQLSPSRETYEVLSALSHACQLINVIAFYLHINLPFRLHQLEFNKDNLTIDCLCADIAKLNTNIISSCLSQGMKIEFKDATYTLGNLLKLLEYQEYPSRSRPVHYSQDYIDMIEKEINEISRTFISDYWFDDDEEKNDLTDILNDYEWESIPQNDYIADDRSIYEHSDSSPSTSSHQPSSIMSNSIDYLKSTSSMFINSWRYFKS